LDIDIEDNGDGTFSIYYTVKDAGDYTLSVKFGGQPVPDGFYTFTVSAGYLKSYTLLHGVRIRKLEPPKFCVDMYSSVGSC
jgi:hypothetical protein